MITERLRRVGSWEIKLRDDTPAEIKRQLRLGLGTTSKGWSLCVVTPQRVDPADFPPPANPTTTAHPLLSAARWAGWLLDLSSSALDLSGEGLLAVCGDSDGAGEYVPDLADKAVHEQASLIIDRLIGGGTLTNVLPGGGTVTFPGSALRKGTINTGGATLTTGDFLRTVRWLLADLSFRAGGYQFRVRPTGHLDWGTYAQLWPGPVRVVIGRGLPAADDPRWVTVRTDGTWSETVNGWANRVVTDPPVNTEGGVAVSPGPRFAPAAATTPYWSPLTVDVLNRYRSGGDFDIENDETTADWRARASALLGPYQDSTITAPDLSGVLSPQAAIDPGELAYLYDPEAGLVDPSNPITYAGQVIHPVAVRLQDATWPVLEPMGVYLLYVDLSFGAFQRILDLSRWVDFDTDPTVRLGVGASAPTL